MSVQILFSQKDVAGAKSNLTKNFWHLDFKKNSNGGYVWGSNKDIKKSNVFPRGKVFDRLHKIQLAKAFSLA